MAQDEPEDEEEGEAQWVFAEAALARAREVASEQAAQALRRSGATAAAAAEGGAAERRPAAPKPLPLEDASRLVLFYAQKLPELCELCGAPSEVRWTAVVFYRRFFVVRSAMEFDPLPMMFASVHLACKIEEVHEITLDRLLEAADFGADASLKARVLSLELPLLEGLRFQLLVEPKPDTALRMLAQELQHLLVQGSAHRRAPATELTEAAWQEVIARAENVAVELTVRTDAILRWPASIVIAAALSTALDEQSGRPANECGDVQALSDVLGALLEGNLEQEAQRVAVRSMVKEVVLSIQRLSNEPEITQDSVKEAAKVARRCHRAFERLREEATERHEAHRKERKRRWSQMKDAACRQVPTPILRDLADLNRKAAADMRRAAADAADEFVIRRPKEDMEDD
uniref:Cyclin H n=1 Tax=Lingulaulax polyedra TaxID=160621 RepID=A0A516AG72_LINPO|nr:cyclin H [Lingulodinium polyedra]